MSHVVIFVPDFLNLHIATQMYRPQSGQITLCM